jgi:rare lipoprotein A
MQFSRQAKGAVRFVAAAGACLCLANCASSNKISSRVDPKYGVSSSPRVVEFGEPVPKGGGTYRVGKPYTVAGRVYVPEENTRYRAEGLASWYGDDFHGRLTANGEVFDMTSLTAAHPTLPIPSYARVTNLKNGKSLIVRVNDRGPYHGNRLIDVSNRAATLLEFRGHGIAQVRVEYVGRAPLEGSDDRQLVATLRTNEPAPPPSAVRVAAAPSFVPEIPQPTRLARRDDTASEERSSAYVTRGSIDPSSDVEPVLTPRTRIARAVPNNPRYVGQDAEEAAAPSAKSVAAYMAGDPRSSADVLGGRGLY